jgi:hypothetical protein
MDQPAFQRRIDSKESQVQIRFKNLMGNIYGEERASSLGKIIAGRSNVYDRDSGVHLAHFSPQQ